MTPFLSPPEAHLQRSLDYGSNSTRQNYNMLDSMPREAMAKSWPTSICIGGLITCGLVRFVQHKTAGYCVAAVGASKLVAARLRGSTNRRVDALITSGRTMKLTTRAAAAFVPTPEDHK